MHSLQYRTICNAFKSKLGFFFPSTKRFQSSEISNSLPKKTDIVVCGGGIIGLSVAYHLSIKGKSVVLFERDCIGCGGATGVSAGLVSASLLWQDTSVQLMARMSMKLYEDLSSCANLRFSRCGRVYLAQSESTEINLRRMFARGSCARQTLELLTDGHEMQSRWPFLTIDDIRLALFIPDDATIDPIGVCQELSRRAKANGVTLMEQCAVKEVLIGDENQIFGVESDVGYLDCHSFVDASGVWCGTIPVKGRTQMKLRMAAQPCTYNYLCAAALSEHVDYPSFATISRSYYTNVSLVVVHDLDYGVYLHPTESATICGGFVEGDIRAIATARSDPSDWHWHSPQPDWDAFYPVLDHLTRRAPSLLKVDHGALICGAESYTPDGCALVGEVPQIHGYYLAGGLNGHGLSLAGGLGSLLADWIIEPTSSVVPKLDVVRFLDLHTNPHYLQQRTPEMAVMTHKPIPPSHQCRSARNVRMSPIHQQLKEHGAIFGEIMGYERPLWFAGSNDVRPSTSLFSGQDLSIGRPEWFDRVAKEYEACRERVGIIDMSNFSKFEVTSKDNTSVVDYLQGLCSADIDKPVGTTIYTGMQNKNGGYITDCTVSRIATNRYFIVAPTVQQVRCRLWMERWALDKSVHIQDVTAMYTAVNVIGPSSRYLMQDITNKSMHPSDFPTFHCKELNVGFAGGIRALSVTHCGELGWVLYIPNEVAQNVYARIVDAGRDYGLMHVGYYALRQLRIEKFYVYWGQDIDSSVTPLECGREFRVDFDKQFIGKKALERLLEEGVPRRYVQLLIDRHDSMLDPWPLGGEPIYRNDQCVGLTTSAGYGFTLSCQICLGYVENKIDRIRLPVTQEFVQKGRYEIDIAGKKYPVRVNLHSPALPMVSSEHPVHYRPTQ